MVVSLVSCGEAEAELSKEWDYSGGDDVFGARDVC